MRLRVFAILLAVIVVVVDQASKQWISSHFILTESMPVLPFFSLTLLHNTGSAFSFLSQASGWQRWLFIGVSAFISLVILIWITRLQAKQCWQAWALGLILGGALGNLWDRICYGYVIDFLDFFYKQWHWPVFNVADSAVCVGTVMLIIYFLFLEKDKS